MFSADVPSIKMLQKTIIPGKATLFLRKIGREIGIQTIIFECFPTEKGTSSIKKDFWRSE